MAMFKSAGVLCGLVAMALASPALAAAESYVIDAPDAHASINFKISHLGFSWLIGRFDRFSGTFDFDPQAPDKSKVRVEIDTSSVNSNQAQRDKHLRSPEFLDVAKFPKATFESTNIKVLDDGSADVSGRLTLHGVTKDIVIKAKKVGSGDDPWGGFRRGFEGTTSLKLKDYNINFNLGPSSTEVELNLYIEGIRQ